MHKLRLFVGFPWTMSPLPISTGYLQATIWQGLPFILLAAFSMFVTAFLSVVILISCCCGKVRKPAMLSVASQFDTPRATRSFL